MPRPTNRLPSHGLYAITDSALIGGDKLLPAVEAALVGGTAILQYRDKGQDQPRREREARALLRLCQQYRVPLIINDDIALAATVGADGVHLGQQDAPIAQARQMLGPEAIIGLSCYDNPEADVQGADYVAFGRFFPSTTKPDAQPADISILSKARQRLNLPIVAIGGINAQNGHYLRDAGADILAVVAGLFAADDITAAARTLAALYPNN